MFVAHRQVGAWEAKRIGEQRQSLPMASLGCVLFTSVESQYKNGSSASRLMVSGAKLITQSFLPNKADGTGQRTPEIQRSSLPSTCVTLF